MQGTPHFPGNAGAEMEDRGMSGYRVARTDSAPQQDPLGRTQQTHPAHGTGSRDGAGAAAVAAAAAAACVLVTIHFARVVVGTGID